MKRGKRRIELNYDTIIKAVHGDPDSISDVLQYYDAYMTALSTYDLVDQDSNERTMVAPDIKAQLQHKLIDAIKKWKVVL